MLVIVALVAALPGLAALILQQYNQRQTRLLDSHNANTSERLDTTKEVLENWSRIVQVQMTQITTLQSQVAALEGSNRECQTERLDLLRQLAAIEGVTDDGYGRLSTVTASLQEYVNLLTKEKEL